MGAESSTLQSVESLNQTLLNVEQRLFDIENFHLHHERNVTLENQLFICGKSIRCNSHVNLVIGPVLGVVNASNARILIEVNTKTELECHLFKQVESFTENRYYKSFSFDIIGNKPYCMVLDNLDQDTLYLAYIGGIKQEDVVYNVVQFYTSSSADRMRYFLSSKALVDSSIPSETCLLENISTKINYSCQLQQNQNSSHYYINIGGFLNVQEIVRKYAYELLRLIQADQFRSETWNSILNSFEKDVKIRYVNAFRESTFAGLARKCSILLFAGEEETAAAVLQSMMKNDEDIVIDDSSSLQESISTSLKSKMSRSKSTMVNDKSIFSKNVRESKNKIDNVAMLSKDDQKELKLLTISLVGRVLRQVTETHI